MTYNHNNAEFNMNKLIGHLALIFKKWSKTHPPLTRIYLGTFILLVIYLFWALSYC